MDLNNNILLITKEFPKIAPGGRELLNKFNHDVLSNIFAEKLKVLFLTPNPSRNLKKLFASLRCHIDGIDSEAINSMKEIIKKEKVKLVFIDGSNLGVLSEIGKKSFPDVKFIVFFHNVEFLFFYRMFKQNKNPLTLAVSIINYFAEKKALKNADEIIMLNLRDKNDLERFFVTKKVNIIPNSLEDNLKTTTSEIDFKDYMLFVGGAFFANYHGIKWFCENVAPLVNQTIVIIGYGFSEYKEELSIDKKIIVYDYVEDLNIYYKNAKFVIAPIFHGSGMKTKVAEALMHGKKIIGTPEAFVGYEDHRHKAGWICNNANEFVSAIDSANNSIDEYYDEDLRKIYRDNYSYESAIDEYKKIL